VEPRPRLLVLNQYYAPGLEATAQLLAQLCESIAAEWEVRVITGRIRFQEDEPDHELRNGVEVIRVHSTAYDRAPLVRRATNYFTYLASALRRALTTPVPDVVLCMTDPPLVGNVAHLVARRFRRPLVIVSQDVFPEIAIQVQRLANPIALAVLRRLITRSLRSADRIVAIGPVMRTRLIDKGAPPAKTVVIPNWVDVNEIAPQAKDNDWTREHGLVDRFVVMHAGNVGHAQNLDVLLRATALLRDLDQLEVVIVGTGARHAHTVELAERLEINDRVRFLEYQDRERLPKVLAAADVHFVGLPRGLAGYIVPSRVNGILAAGRPILAAVDEESETADVIRRAQCGTTVAPDNLPSVAAVLRDMVIGKIDLAGQGANARRFAERELSLEGAVSAYHAVLRDVRL
jgi:colanic acid biosynthesis glycosyl transferase WcaI